MPSTPLNLTAFEGGNALSPFRAQALQARLQGSVWTQCRSWYRTDGGKVVALWPGFTAEYVRGLRRPEPADFQLRWGMTSRRARPLE